MVGIPFLIANLPIFSGVIPKTLCPFLKFSDRANFPENGGWISLLNNEVFVVISIGSEKSSKAQHASLLVCSVIRDYQDLCLKFQEGFFSEIAAARQRPLPNAANPRLVGCPSRPNKRIGPAAPKRKIPK